MLNLLLFLYFLLEVALELMSLENPNKPVSLLSPFVSLLLTTLYLYKYF